MAYDVQTVILLGILTHLNPVAPGSSHCGGVDLQLDLVIYVDSCTQHVDTLQRVLEVVLFGMGGKVSILVANCQPDPHQQGPCRLHGAVWTSQPSWMVDTIQYVALHVQAETKPSEVTNG